MYNSVGIVINDLKEKALPLARQLEEGLAAAGMQSVTMLVSASAKQRQAFFRAADCLVVLGGDGTVLSVAKEAAAAGLPIIGVKLGRVGFLSELAPENILSLIPALQNQTYSICPRLMLMARVNGESFYALNEICIQRPSHEKMIRLRIYCNGELVDGYAADGVMLATPTGSTAYSLSAGGPIMNPYVQAMLLTPICAHTLRSRPIVFPDTETVSVVTEPNTDISLLCDGKERAFAGLNQPVEITRSPSDALFLQLAPVNFYRLLNSKLNEWSKN